MDKDDAASAFDHPNARSLVEGCDPLDRISVRDYVREIEIGAFDSEYGVTQRVRFNAVVEVSRHTAALDDDVDKVVSYDNITDAIEAQIAAGRIDLLETFAENIAKNVLDDPRVARIILRVEKLDRIPGALGVEIVRSRSDVAPDSSPIAAADTAGKRSDPLLVFLDQNVLQSDTLTDWFDAAERLNEPVIFCLPPLAVFKPGSVTERVALLSFDQMAWQVASSDERLSVISTRTELEHAIKTPCLVVWAPSKMVSEDIGASPDLHTLAMWLKNRLGASRLVATGVTGIGETSGISFPRDLKGE